MCNMQNLFLNQIVEEDTAIYFVENDFNSKDFMYENDGNEDYQFECGSADESSVSEKLILHY